MRPERQIHEKKSDFFQISWNGLKRSQNLFYSRFFRPKTFSLTGLNEPGNLKGEPHEIMKQKRRVKMKRRMKPGTLNLANKNLSHLKGGTPSFSGKWADAAIAKVMRCENGGSNPNHNEDQCQKCPCGRYHCSHYL